MQLQLSQICSIKLNFPEADFWIIRVGSAQKVGMPVKTFNKEMIGIKVLRTDLVLSDFLFYCFVNLHTQRYFEIFCAHGTLNLVCIRISQIKNIVIQLGSV